MSEFGPLQPGIPREKSLAEILEGVMSKYEKVTEKRDEKPQGNLKKELDPILDPIRKVLEDQKNLTKAQVQRSSFSEDSATIPREKSLAEILEGVISKYEKVTGKIDEKSQRNLKKELDPIRDLLDSQKQLTRSQMSRAEADQDNARRIATENANEEKIARKNLNERLMEVLGGIKGGLTNLFDKVKKLETPNLLVTAGAAAAFLLLQDIIPPRLVGQLLARRLPFLVRKIFQKISGAIKSLGQTKLVKAIKSQLVKAIKSLGQTKLVKSITKLLTDLQKRIKPFLSGFGRIARIVTNILTGGLTSNTFIKIVTKFASVIKSVIKKIAPVIKVVTKFIGDIVGKVIKVVPFLGRILGAVGKFIPYVNVALAFFSAIFGAFKGISIASEREDVTGLQGAILGAIAGLYEFLTFGLFDFEDLFEPMIEIWNAFQNEGFIPGVKMLFEKVWGGIKEKGREILEWVAGWLPTAFKGVVTFITSIPPMFVKAVTGLHLFLIEKILNLLGVSTEPGTIGGSIIGFMHKIRDTVVGAFENIYKAIRAAILAVGGWVGRRVARIFGINEDGTDKKERPRAVQYRMIRAANEVADRTGISVKQAQDLIYGGDDVNYERLVKEFGEKDPAKDAEFNAAVDRLTKAALIMAETGQSNNNIQVNNAGAQTTYLSATNQNNLEPSLAANNRSSGGR